MICGNAHLYVAVIIFGDVSGYRTGHGAAFIACFSKAISPHRIARHFLFAPFLPLSFATLTQSSWRRRVVLVLLAWLVLPYVLVPLYAVVPPISTVMLGSLLSGEGMRREWVPLSSIAPSLPRAVLSSEDDGFCEHWGIEPAAMRKAMREAERGRVRHGGSTITMQVAKNLFFWRERSYLRKILEVPLALWMDLVLPKRRILEIYLNIAEWGPGIFGAQAAAEHHFHKSAAALSASEATLLATALPNPRTRDAAHPRAWQARLAATLQGRMARLGPVTECLR